MVKKNTIHGPLALVKPQHGKLPLTALRTFEAAARRLSFKDAADELCVSATTVSNQIRALERDWGCQLFIRKTRAVVLTDAGRSLSAVVHRAFRDIREEINLHTEPVAKTVTLAVGPMFGSRWLVPRLSRFQRSHPDIDLVVTHSPRITSVESLSSQVAVDWGDGDWHGLDVTPLFVIDYSPVISPALVHGHKLQKPSDLARYSFIHQRDRSEWGAWLTLAGSADLMSRGDTVVMDSNVAVQAAIDAQGVALGSFPFLDNDVASGRLLKPFAINLRPTRQYNLLVRHGARRTQEVNAVCSWIESEALMAERNTDQSIDRETSHNTSHNANHNTSQ